MVIGQTECDNHDGIPRIQRTTDDPFEPFDLTDLQNAYWVGRNEVFDFGGVCSHIYFEAEADGSLDYGLLNRSWQKLIDRHEMLRMVITPQGQQRIIKNPPPFSIGQSDLGSLNPTQKDEALASIRERLHHRTSPAETWPLFDIHYTRIDERRGRIHVSMDLLIADIWSINMLMGQWFRFYQGHPHSVESPDISFQDYVAHLEKIIETPLYARSRDYWSQRLETLPRSPQLPLVPPEKRSRRARFTNREFRLSQPRWRHLQSKALSRGITPSNLLMAAYCRILSCWSKGSDFSLNLTLFNRLNLHPDINQIVGDFTSVLVVEIRNSGSGSFAEFARGVQRQLAKDLEHRYFSGIEVIRGLEKEGSASVSMPVVFTGALSLEGGLGVSENGFFGRRVYKVTQTPQVYLDNQVYEESGELIISWDSVDDLFLGDTVEDMFSAYTSLIESLADDDQAWEQPGGNFIPQAQLRQREASNRTDKALKPEPLHWGFVQNAIIQPEKDAVITSHRTVRYGELLAAALRIAENLTGLGIETGAIVAIHMQKGWEQIASVLGILMAGGVYVNVEPELPLERKKILIADSGARTLVVTDASMPDRLFEESLKCLVVDTSFLTPIKELSLTQPGPSEDTLAYLIYTSGSTGMPKGVMITHHSAFNTILDINERIELTVDDRVLALSSLSFDLSVYDVFGLLKAGGTLVIPDEGEGRNPGHWMELMEKHRVTVWNSVPALMGMLVEYAEGNAPNRDLALRVALLSGDKIPIDLPGRAMALIPGLRVLSLGGATEASIWSIYYPVAAGEVYERSVPYGKALTNQKMYVFNKEFGQCPDYVQGEIYIGGVGLAVGYFRDDEKTSAAFIRHPVTGERIYRTGDTGYVSPDGNIQFLGREDFQFKIGGFRVEPGEIESVLVRHPRVAKAAVKKETGKDGNEFLAAYVLLHPSTSNLPYDYGTEIEASPGTALLTDGNDRRLFKLKQSGIRQISGASIQLETDGGDQRGLYLDRATTRRFMEDTVPRLVFGRFLHCLRRMEHEEFAKYRYASAGGLYPVQVYLYIKEGRVEGIPGGFYYYNPGKHCLIELDSKPFNGDVVHVPANRPVYDSSALSIFFVGDLQAIKPMYGVKSRDFCLIEAGLIAQLLENTAMTSGMGLCQIGAFKDDVPVRDALRLEENHLILHAMEAGIANFNDPFRKTPSDISSETKTGNPLSEIRNFARSTLPHYMIPAVWNQVEAIPLTRTGKVDYKRLAPIPGQHIANNDRGHRPENRLEAQISKIFETLLNMPSPDTESNFFEIGADSLTVVRAWRELTNQAGLNFTVAKMFENPTIRKLARYVSSLTSSATDSERSSSHEPYRKQALRKRLKKKA